jgi:hypothetical protein
MRVRGYGRAMVERPRSRRLGIGALPALAAAFAMVLAPAANGRKTHTYQPVLSIAVDRSTHEISGTITSEPQAPSHFCEAATVRLMRQVPGQDEAVAHIRPHVFFESNWKFKSPGSLRGARVYAEVSAYHLRDRPIECLAGRSRTVTAP